MTPDITNQQNKSILMVFPLAPWPLRENGVSIRYYPIIEHLVKDHSVDVFVLEDVITEPFDDPILKTLNRVNIEKVNSHRPTLADRLWTLGESLSPFGKPFNYAKYHANGLHQKLRRFIAGGKYDTVLWVSCVHRNVLNRLSRSELKGSRIVYDSVDSPYLHYSRQLNSLDDTSLWRAYDLWKTRRWERSLLRGVDASIYISRPDASACGTTLEPQVIPNGIYTADEQVIHQVVGQDAPCIGFLGNMAYRPNVRAVRRLHDRIFLPLKKEIPDLKLMIIGRSPVPEISELAGPDVIVTGTVDSIWPYIAQVTVFVYPMDSGAGLQNKILEAMHAARPVVTTEICSNSVGARNGRDILSADTDEEIRASTRTLLGDRQLAHDIAERGKQYVDETFAMSKVLEKFERLLFPRDSAAEWECPMRPGQISIGDLVRTLRG